MKCYIDRHEQISLVFQPKPVKAKMQKRKNRKRIQKTNIVGGDILKVKSSFEVIRDHQKCKK
jgi:hypothetical protein